MLGFIKQKMLNKKVLNLCLVVGIMFFSAISMSHILYKEGAVNKIISIAFDKYIEERNQYPCELKREFIVTPDKEEKLDFNLDEAVGQYI